MGIKVGLALGSGAARGFAHIGVLEAFEEASIPIHVVAGTSMGAVVGGLFSAGLTSRKIADFAMAFGDKRISYWMDPSFFTGGGLLKGEKIEQALRKQTGQMDFSDLKLPFYAVASDLITGKEVVISSGDLHHAIRASFSVPGIFSPTKDGQHWLVDGALLSPIPTRVLKEVECDVIIAVSVGVGLEQEIVVERDSSPSIVESLLQAFAVTQKTLMKHCTEMADITISPEVGNYRLTDFSKASELIQKGYEEANKWVPAIKRLIAIRRFTAPFRRLFL